MATSLTSDDCRSVAEANERFSTQKGLLVLRPARRGGCSPCSCSALHFTVPSGCYALVTRHGADVDYVDADGKTSAIWPPGLHYPYPPWVRVSHLVTMQSVVMDAPVKACKTRDNVSVNVDVALVFRIMGDAERGEDPASVRRFVHEVKPRGLDQQLRDAQEEAVRALARSMTHTEIFGIRSGDGEEEEKEKDGGDAEREEKGQVGEAGAAITEVLTETTLGPDQGEGANPVLRQSSLSGEVDLFYDAEVADSGVPPQQQPQQELQPSLGMIEPLKTVGGGPENPNQAGEEEEERDFAEDEPLLGGTSDVEDRKAASAASTKGKKVAAAMRDRLNRQFVPQGVQILSVAIKEITLPDNIVSQMSEKTMVISQNAQQGMEHEHAMQNERMEQQIQTMLQTFKEQREKEIAAGREGINKERVRLDDAVAQASKVEAEMREEAEVKVLTIHAGNELVTQRIRNKIMKDTARIEADARRHCAELRASTKVAAKALLSDAELRAAENRADVDKIMSNAEGLISQGLEMKREHTTLLKQLQVYQRLAENKNLILSGTADEDENIVAVADAILEGSEREGDEPSAKSLLIAELALLKSASSAFMSHAKED